MILKFTWKYKAQGNRVILSNKKNGLVTSTREEYVPGIKSD